ncbi:MAG: hypothetical protein LKJ17_09375 [Oscillospiraceae bacterium]|jgi:hypothetical protein|nr:hypothetical protein [Oscillospiraceae bacterium]
MFSNPVKRDGKGNITKIVLTKKIFKKLDKESQGKFVPSTFSVKKLCSVGKHPEYFNQVKNRIFRELAEDSSLGNYIYLNPEDLDDVWLSWKGAFFLDEVLTSYFSHNFIRYVIRLCQSLDKSKRISCDLSKALSDMPTPDLKDFINRFDEYLPGDKADEARQDFKRLALTELKGRSWIYRQKKGLHI